MRASQIRDQLLREHDDIRTQIDDVWGAIVADQPIRAALARLAETVKKHNHREEELLREMLPSVDAWGPARTEVMFEEHEKEHDEIFEALLRATDAAEIRLEVEELVDRLRAHMTKEEKTFLAEDILVDDLIVRDSFGG
jgi:hemerythrin